MPEGLQGQILEMLLLAILLCFVLVGSNRGLILSLYSMIKYLLVIVATVAIAPVIEKRLSESITSTEGVGFTIALVISIIVFAILGRMFKLINSVPVLGGLNKLGGALLGLICGFVVVWTVLALLGVFQEYDWCHNMVLEARKNDVVMWFQDCNPIPAILKRFDFPVM